MLRRILGDGLADRLGSKGARRRRPARKPPSCPGPQGSEGLQRTRRALEAQEEKQGRREAPVSSRLLPGGLRCCREGSRGRAAGLSGEVVCFILNALSKGLQSIQRDLQAIGTQV